ncbi:MAG: hypothetical protein ABGX16_18115 [Pirellulales bacterium]
MRLFSPSERQLCRAISGLGYANPFLTERLQWEQKILGEAFESGEPVWSMKHAAGMETANLQKISQLAQSLSRDAQKRLAQGVVVEASDAQL